MEDNEWVIIKGRRGPTTGGLVTLKVLREERRAEREYPLAARAVNSILTVAMKSDWFEHILENLRSCDFRRPAYVCLG